MYVWIWEKTCRLCLSEPGLLHLAWCPPIASIYLQTKRCQSSLWLSNCYLFMYLKYDFISEWVLHLLFEMKRNRTCTKEFPSHPVFQQTTKLSGFFASSQRYLCMEKQIPIQPQHTRSHTQTPTLTQNTLYAWLCLLLFSLYLGGHS
jgi:hypothetical protein